MYLWEPSERVSFLFGCPTRIRTQTNRVRVCRATLTQSGNACCLGQLIYYIPACPACQDIFSWSQTSLLVRQNPPGKTWPGVFSKSPVIHNFSIVFLKKPGIIEENQKYTKEVVFMPVVHLNKESFEKLVLEGKTPPWWISGPPGAAPAKCWPRHRFHRPGDPRRGAGGGRSTWTRSRSWPPATR